MRGENGDHFVDGGPHENLLIACLFGDGGRVHVMEIKTAFRELGRDFIITSMIFLCARVALETRVW
jgi:hypothetical protein